MSNPMNRRKFLTRAAAGVGAATLTCCGLSSLALRAPIDPSSEHLFSGTNPMNQKVLVTYASRAGSTMEVAQTVADQLTSRGLAVDLRPIKQVSGVAEYSAVVVGSAIRMGQCLPEVMKFVEKHSAALNQMPTALFALHLMNIGSTEDDRTARQAYLEPVRKLVKLQSEALFSGVGDMSKLSFLDGMIAKMVKSPEGDFRDWDTIRAWAQGLLPQ
jgi:menaquinone-dependent protoporphyrinogen oxidase